MYGPCYKSSVVVICRLLTVEAQIQSYDSPYGIYGGNSGMGQDLLLSPAFFLPLVIPPILRNFGSSGDV
jgi:hypothetical protein